MSAGKLRHRVVLQKYEENPDAPGWASGSQSEIWQDVATVWASVEHLRGEEQFTAGAVFENAVVKIMTRRFSTPIEATKPYRFVWNGNYKVREIDETTKRGYLIFTCEKMEQ